MLGPGHTLCHTFAQLNINRHPFRHAEAFREHCRCRCLDPTMATRPADSWQLWLQRYPSLHCVASYVCARTVTGRESCCAGRAQGISCIL